MHYYPLTVYIIVGLATFSVGVGFVLAALMPTDNSEFKRLEGAIIGLLFLLCTLACIYLATTINYTN